MPDLGDLHDSIISALDGASGGTCEHCVSGVFTKQADVVLALVDQFLSGHARPFTDEWPATMVKAQLKVATAVLDSMKADDERAGEALETIARLAAESPDPGPQPEPEPAPPLPLGDYGRMELPGFRSHTGWWTPGVLAGQSVMVCADRDGNAVAEYIPGPASRFVRLPVPAFDAAGGWGDVRPALAAGSDDIDGGYGAHIPACHDPECDGECMERTPF